MRHRPFLSSLGRLRLLVAALICLMPLASWATVLDMPAPATALGERRADLTSYRLPTGPFGSDGVPSLLTEGSLDQTAWRLDAAGRSTLQILAPLRRQLDESGWKILFECETEDCGGFDFRYGIDVLPEPEMHVDLGDFRFLSASRGDAHLSLLVSRSADLGFVQMTLVGAAPEPDLSASTKSPAIEAVQPTATVPPAPPESPLVAALNGGQAAVLDDLIFASGKGWLAPGDYASLADLADWLAAHPDRRVELVGHSDSLGSRQANTDLSLKRASSVRDILSASFGIDPARVAARGVGPEDPRADNATPEGRALNRRVEVRPIALP